MPFSYRSIAGLAIALDAFLIVGAGVLSSTVYHSIVFGGSGLLERNIAVSVFAALIFGAIARANKLYSPTQLLLWHVQLNHVVWIWCVTFFLLSGWLFVWKAGDDISRGAILSFWGLGLLALIAHRAFWRLSIERALKSGSLRGRKAVAITTSSAGLDANFAKKLTRHGYEVVREFVVPESPAGEGAAALEQAISFVRGSEVEEILLAVGSGDIPRLGQIADQLRILPLPVTCIADGLTAELVKRPWFDMGSAVAIELQKPPRSRPERALKRGLDFIFAGASLVFLLPVFLVVAIVIKTDSAGPILFGQMRRGFNGKPFRIFKFRSMNVLEDGEAIEQAKKGDPRATRVGAWLRKTSIDEIPQLLNVLRGEMSLVGPRPHAIAHDDQFIETVEDYAYRHHVKPGITGWAQVHGYRGETPTLAAIARRVELDRWYIANWSVWLDFKIMLRTLASVARGKNAY